MEISALDKMARADSPLHLCKVPRIIVDLAAMMYSVNSYPTIRCVFAEYKP
ncbi:MAG: hypothetical protein P4L59_15915 [Desulfosporosinus sp.]|nr:hypothetical protein [Desulfosporosinus sp.]